MWQKCICGGIPSGFFWQLPFKLKGILDTVHTTFVEDKEEPIRAERERNLDGYFPVCTLFQKIVNLFV